MVVNAVLAIGLSPYIGYLAAAFGTTLAAWAMVILLWRGARRHGEAARFDARYRSRMRRIALASALMGAVVWATNLMLGPLWDGPTKGLALALLVGAGIGAYALLGQALGAFRAGELRAAMRRG